MHQSDNSNESDPADKVEKQGHLPDAGLKNDSQKLQEVLGELEACKNELREKEQALSELRDKLDKLSDSNPLDVKEVAFERMANEMQKAQEMATMGSWVLHLDTGEVSWTPELHKIFRQDPSCPVPTMEEQKNWYTEQSWKNMVEAVARTSKDGSPYNIELETIRQDGSTGMVRSIGEAERDESGRIVRLRGVAQDISDIKETEYKLKFALEQEKAAQIYKDQFLANMSHEIRTPMNGVVGFASLLRDEDLDYETRTEYINVIESCSNQLLNLIDDILDIAKIEAGEIKIKKKSFDLVKLTQETAATLDTIRDQKGKHHIPVTIHIPEAIEYLDFYSDPLRIQQILTNLLNNAVKFTDKGHIEFGFELKGEAVEFFVKDEGIGIEPERLNLIYKRFEHLEGTTQKYEGTGLGLSISLGLAELLGATLTVESELGAGSTFRLKIPLATAPNEASAEAQQKPVNESEKTRTCTVLVAEDEEANLKLIQRILKSAPFRVLIANNGEQAVLTYQKHPEIDVVLMDIRMPLMNGDVAAKEILKIDQDAKIIAQTAYAMQEERGEFLKIGFVDYLPKPYKTNDLLTILNKWAS